MNSVVVFQARAMDTSSLLSSTRFSHIYSACAPQDINNVNRRMKKKFKPEKRSFHVNCRIESWRLSCADVLDIISILERKEISSRVISIILFEHDTKPQNKEKENYHLATTMLDDAADFVDQTKKKFTTYERKIVQGRIRAAWIIASRKLVNSIQFLLIRF